MNNVQYAVKIREYGVLEADLMSHYAWIPREKAQKVNDNHGCGKPDGEKVRFNLSGLISGCSFQFVKGRIGSIEIIADSEQEGVDCAVHLFKLDRTRDRKHLPKMAS